MSEKKARIHMLAFRTKCEAYGCKNTSYGGHTMYAIGIPNHLSQKPVFCGECVQAMMQNLPEELGAIVGVSATPVDETANDLRIAELEALVSTLMPAPENKQPEEVTPEIEVFGTPIEGLDISKPDEPDHPEGTLLRCLDCGEEFARKTELTKHKNKVHPEV